LAGLLAAYQSLTTKYGPAQLAEAQARDRGNIEGNRFAQNMGNATGLMINNPGAVKFAPPVPMEVQNFVQQRELGKENLATQTQMMQMDPNGPIAKATIAALGLPPGTSPMVAKAMMDALKERAGLEHTTAETTNLGATAEKTREEIPGARANARKATAEATASEIENGPAAPAMLAMGKKLGVQIPASTTNKQAREIIDAEAKRQGIAVDWAKVGLEGKKMDVEMARYGSEHPGTPVPGLKYVGPGAPPARDSEPVKALAQAKSDTDTVKGDLAELKRIYNDASYRERVMGSKSQELDTLHERIMGALGRAAANGRLAAYDVALAKSQLPLPSSLRGAVQSGKINAAIDTIVQRVDAGYASQARAHNFEPEGAAPAASGGAPVRKFTRDEKGALVEVKP
jgi:hypothetical protein